MKKILQLITGGLIKDVGKVIDNLTTTDEERLAAKLKIEELLEQADKDAQDQVTARWESDMNSDSFLSKNIRPMVLIYLTIVFTILSFFDGNVGEFKIAEQYVPIFQSLLITVYGAYFVGRTWEKSKKISTEAGGNIVDLEKGQSVSTQDAYKIGKIKDAMQGYGEQLTEKDKKKVAKLRLNDPKKSPSEIAKVLGLGERVTVISKDS
jgi:hypothetical protein